MLSEDDLLILLFLLLAMFIKRGLTNYPRGLSPVIRSDIGCSVLWGLSLALISHDQFPGLSLETPPPTFVDTFCGHFCRHFLRTLFVGHFLTLFVDTFCRHFLWTLFVDTFCGHFLLTLFVDTVNTFWDFFCGHFMWTLIVDIFCRHL